MFTCFFHTSGKYCFALQNVKLCCPQIKQNHDNVLRQSISLDQLPSLFQYARSTIVYHLLLFAMQGYCKTLRANKTENAGMQVPRMLFDLDINARANCIVNYEARHADFKGMYKYALFYVE